MWVRWCVPQEDLDQERALAILEDRDPRVATRAYIARERHFYDAIVPFTDSQAGLSVRKYGRPAQTVAEAPMPVFRYRRSPESIECRKAYTRDWWRKNGAEYRRRRAVSQPGRTTKSPPAPQP